MNRGYAVIGLLAMIPVGCQQAADPSDPAADAKYEDVSGTFKSREAFDSVKDAEKITIRRLKDSFYQDSIDKYKTVGDPVEVKPDDAKAFKRLLLSGSSYLFDVAKGCEPIFGVRLTFEKEDHTTDVLFCFECDILTIYYDGERAGGEDFDPIRMELLKVIKPLFPNDEAIQSLKKR